MRMDKNEWVVLKFMKYVMNYRNLSELNLKVILIQINNILRSEFCTGSVISTKWKLSRSGELIRICDTWNLTFQIFGTSHVRTVLYSYSNWIRIHVQLIWMENFSNLTEDVKFNSFKSTRVNYKKSNSTET